MLSSLAGKSPGSCPDYSGAASWVSLAAHFRIASGAAEAKMTKERGHCLFSGERGGGNERPCVAED